MDVYLCGYSATIARWGCTAGCYAVPQRPSSVTQISKRDKSQLIEAINVKKLLVFGRLETALAWAAKHTYETPYSLPSHSVGCNLYQMEFKPILHARIQEEGGVRRIVSISAMHLCGVMGHIALEEGEIPHKSQTKLGPLKFTTGVIGRSLTQSKQRGEYTPLL